MEIVILCSFIARFFEIFNNGATSKIWHPGILNAMATLFCPKSKAFLGWTKEQPNILGNSKFGVSQIACATAIKVSDEGACLILCATVNSWFTICVHGL